MDLDLQDLSYPRAVLIAFLVTVNLALVGAVTTSATPHGPYNGAWDGGSTLRTSATSSDASTTHAIDTEPYETVTANGTVAFIVAPQEDYSPTAAARVRQFVQRGGTVVVASEDNRTDRLLSELGVETRIDGRPVRDEREHYRGPALPVATNVNDHPLTDGVESLTLNYGTVLNRSRAGNTAPRSERVGEVLVNTSGFAYVDANENETLDFSETVGPRPVVVVEPIGEGAVVVVSDASVFTNAMLDREGNAQFATTLLTSHERVLLDYSHGRPLPPLIYALLVVRDTPLLQFVLGLGAVGAVVGWTYRDSLPTLAGVSFGPTPEERLSGVRPDEAELAAFLADRHPDWDADRIERVTKALIQQRQESDTNE